MRDDLIRVIFADDHSVVRAGLKAVLGAAKDMHVVGEASTGPEAVARRIGAVVEITVRDTGAGIPPGELPRIFDRYWTVRRNAPKGGTGLGLAIARGIVEAHGGRLWAESKVGKGSTFRFTVPVG